MTDLLDDDDDGFSRPANSLARRGNNYAKWDEKDGWRDRDGVALTGQFLVAKIGEGLQNWENNQPRLKVEKPLPNIDELNRGVPVSKWPLDFNGNPEPPWKHVVIVLLVDPVIGATYKYIHHTVGAHIAYDNLQDQVIMMRALRGVNVFPIVTLEDRPMKKKGGVWGSRPHFEIVGWKTPGGDDEAALPAPATPQLTGPVAAPPSATPPVQTASPPVASTPKEPRPHPIPAPATKVPSAKRPVTISAYTQAVMTGMADVKPVTTEELLNDSLDDMPWDSNPTDK
jgi:hypothetical protein